MQVKEHFLFEFVLSIVNCNTVVVSIQSVGLCNSTWLLNVTNVRGCLSRLGLRHHRLLINGSEGVDDHSTFNRLNWVDNNGYSSWVQHFLWLLSFDICSWEPGPKTWVRVVPTYTTLVTTNLLHHLHKLLLVYWINRLHGDSGTHLWHGKNIYYTDRVVVVNLTNHETHNFKGNTCGTMLHHLKES